MRKLSPSSESIRSTLASAGAVLLAGLTLVGCGSGGDEGVRADAVADVAEASAGGAGGGAATGDVSFEGITGNPQVQETFECFEVPNPDLDVPSVQCTPRDLSASTAGFTFFRAADVPDPITFADAKIDEAQGFMAAEQAANAEEYAAAGLAALPREVIAAEYQLIDAGEITGVCRGSVEECGELVGIFGYTTTGYPDATSAEDHAAAHLAEEDAKAEAEFERREAEAAKPEPYDGFDDIGHAIREFGKVGVDCRSALPVSGEIGIEVSKCGSGNLLAWNADIGKLTEEGIFEVSETTRFQYVADDAWTYVCNELQADTCQSVADLTGRPLEDVAL